MENTTELAASRQLRHRRRMQRSQREQTPTTNHQLSQEDYGDVSPQRVSMQIRAPGVMSAHESKILRRRDKSFAGTAARSQSQPREAEKLSSPDAHQLLVKHRSLSSPRHKEQQDQLQSSESEMTGSSQSTPLPMQEQVQRGNAALSRLEQNLQRFEDERRRFEAEKRLFEREKREHKQRHRQQLDHEERKRLLQNYRKISDGFQLPQDEEDRRRLVQSLRLQRHEVPTVRSNQQRKHRSSGYEESSTQFSSSDADTAEEHHARQKLQPVRGTAGQTYVAAPIRGAPPPPPSTSLTAPKPPERQSVSRNNSLSPVRPQRRSKTPEQRPTVEESVHRKQEYVEIGETPSGGGQPVKVKLSEAEQRDALRRAYEEAAAKAAEAEAALAKSLRRSNSLRVPTEVEQTPKVDSKRSSSLERPKGEAKRSGSLERPARTKRTPSLERPTKREEAQTKAVASAELEVSSQLVAKLEEEAPTASPQPEKPSLLRRLGNLFTRKQHKEVSNEVTKEVSKEISTEPKAIVSRAFLRSLRLEAVHEWRRLKLDYPVEMMEMRQLRNKCIGHMILLILLLGFGGLLFRYTEGMSEDIYKCEVRKVKRDFIDNLWTVSHNMRYMGGL